MTNDFILEEVDLNIITCLKENARASFAEIGRKIKLSPSATRERIHKLEERGVIKKYSVELDNKLLGHEMEAFILVKVFHGNLKRLFSYISTKIEITEAHRITGNQNVHLKVLLKNQIHLQQLIDELMQFGDTSTFLILSKI
ncbi:Transcriptional regulator, AsnC family [Tenacibaculum sp. 190524A02b]|uniref:Transcriptional regulator, AsnC family n=1 Tax=Tenacibaculum vairaonense TaxID=3137860 RepID=A0ABM9PR27_9FLAO